MLCNKRLSKFSHNAIAKSVLCDAAILLPRINLKITNIAVQWIGTFPDFNAPFYWLRWNILLHAQLSFEGNHGFIHGKILARSIFFTTGFQNSFEERSNFKKFVVIWLTSRYRIFVVVQMKVLLQFIKSVSGHYSLHECNSKGSDQTVQTVHWE